MKRTARCVLLTVAVLLWGTAGTVEAEWSFQWLGRLPGDNVSRPGAISADGSTVVGTSMLWRSEDEIYPEAFRWTQSGGMVGLEFLPGGNASGAEGVSDDGSVVVGSCNGQAYRWTAGNGMQALGIMPGTPYSAATDVSADGSVVVGTATRADWFGQRAFYWTQSEGMVSLGLPPGGEWSRGEAVSSDGSVIVGNWGLPSYAPRGFLWNREQGFRDLGDNIMWVYDVSADGSVVVGEKYTAGYVGTEAFRWTEATGAVGLGNLTPYPNDSGAAFGVSPDGSVVVGHGAQLRPLIWDAAHGSRGLIDVLAAEGIYPYDLIMAYDVSFDGRTMRIVGEGSRSATTGREVWLATNVVPEPSSLLLAAVGIVGLAASAFVGRARRAR